MLVLSSAGAPRALLAMSAIAEPGHFLAADLTHRILGSALEVHKRLGPGLLENAYRRCLLRQLEIDGLHAEQEVRIPVRYRDVEIECGYRADVIVERQVLLELKSCDRTLPVYVAQVLTYLKLSGLRVGLLINFNVTRLQAGIRRYVR